MIPSRIGLLVGVSLIGACGGKTDGEQPLPPLAESDYPVAYAAAFCDVLVPCCSVDRATCMSTVIWFDPMFPEAVYSGVKAAECINQVRSVLSHCDVSLKYQSQIHQICKWVYEGTSPAGGPCRVDQDCAALPNGTPRCTYTGGPVAGQCVSDTPGQLGEICGQFPDPSAPFVTHVHCVTGFYCDLTTHCAQTLTQGAACSLDEQCTTSLYCDPASSQCQPPLTLGAPCDPSWSDLQCSTGHCLGGICSTGGTDTRSVCDLLQ